MLKSRRLGLGLGCFDRTRTGDESIHFVTIYVYAIEIIEYRWLRVMVLIIDGIYEGVREHRKYFRVLVFTNRNS